MSSPWTAPAIAREFPLAGVGITQSALDQYDYNGEGQNWISEVVIADLVYGDGFASAENAAEHVLTCVKGLYYSDAEIAVETLKNSETSIDGHYAWLLESHFSFDILGLDAKGEHVIVLVIQVSADQYSLFFGTVPDTSAARLPDVREAMAGLTVDS